MDQDTMTELPFYKKPFNYEELSSIAKRQLSEIPDYPLDYNIFIYKGIKETRNEIKDELKEMRLEIVKESKRSLTNDNNNDFSIHKGIIEEENGEFELELTIISEFQDRLLGLLILERHRRDIELLNQLIEKDDNNTNGNKIKLIQLSNPFKYDIKSIFYKSLISNYFDTYKETFTKFAMFQNIEFEHERIIDNDNNNNSELKDITNDEDLIDYFHDNEDILKFNEMYKVSDTSNEEEYDKIMSSMFENSKIIQILMTLAAQSLFLNS